MIPAPSSFVQMSHGHLSGECLKELTGFQLPGHIDGSILGSVKSYLSFRHQIFFIR